MGRSLTDASQTCVTRVGVRTSAAAALHCSGAHAGTAAIASAYASHAAAYFLCEPPSPLPVSGDIGLL
jgi:hypothetical protein